MDTQPQQEVPTPVPTPTPAPVPPASAAPMQQQSSVAPPQALPIAPAAPAQATSAVPAPASMTPVAPVETSFSPIEPQPAPSASDAVITWSANEYIHPDKTKLWYVWFALVALGFVALDIFIIQSWFYSFSFLVLVMTAAIIVYVRRPARTLTYALSASEGLYIGQELHSFDDFKAFGLITDDGENSIMLMPRKRFAPGVSVYFPEDKGEQIVDILGARLPMEELKLDVVDVIVRKLRL